MHDYDISWDYELDNTLDKKYKNILSQAVKEVKKLKLFNNFEVYPILLPDEELGVYCFGTYEKPIIGVDVRNHIEACKEYNISLKKALKSSILHELRHSWQDGNNYEFDEEDAEDFAYNNV